MLLMTVNYLDNSATTRVSEKAAQKALLMMTEKFGNPSSVYSLGLDAERELNSARETIAKSLGADKTEIFFTSCGTEANNLAIFGAADARKRLGNKIITSAVEHPSVLNAVKELERRGFKAVYLPVGNDGKIRLSDLERELDDLKSNIHKVQVAFAKPQPDVYSALNILSRNTSGSVDMLIVRNSAEEIEDALNPYSPLILDMLPLTLEEIFIYELGGEKNEYSSILL